MGLFELLIYVVVVVLLAAAAVWVMNYLAPDHPKIIDRGIWVLAVVICLLMLARALGVGDPQIPRIR
jgi:hypothetical protein